MSDQIETDFSIQEIIDDNSYSPIARLILLKAIMIPKDWEWRRDLFLKTFNVAEVFGIKYQKN